MPPFQYSGYRNPYVQAMTEAMLAPGQIEAQRAMAVANAQGNAAVASGQAYGHALENIGQTVAAIPQQMEAQKMHALQMQDMQAQIAERNAVAAQRQRDASAQAAGQAAIKGAIGPDGKVDYEKAASAWEAAGFPTQANAYRESVQKTRQTAQALEEGQQKIDAGKRQIQQGYTDHLAELGASGLESLKTNDPIHARDYAMGLVANAASHGLVNPDDARAMLMQTAQASPDQLAGIYQKLVDASPSVKERLVSDALKKAETEKNLAEAGKARSDEKTVTEAQLDAYAQSLYAKKNANQPLSEMEAANLKAYEDRKRVVSDPALLAESQRQTRSIEQQNALQKAAQSFQELQAGRKELTDKALAPYHQALTSAQTMRDTVNAAKAGNLQAANLQSLEQTMAAIRAQGLNRINTTELGVSADAGNLWDRIQSRVGKLAEGQPVDSKLQKDMLQFAGILEKAAYTKYRKEHDSITSLYQMKVPAEDGPQIYARDPQGVLHTAAWGTKLPKDWTQE